MILLGIINCGLAQFGLLRDRTSTPPIRNQPSDSDFAEGGESRELGDEKSTYSSPSRERSNMRVFTYQSLRGAIALSPEWLSLRSNYVTGVVRGVFGV